MAESKPTTPEFRTALVLWNWTDESEELQTIPPSDKDFVELGKAFAQCGLSAQFVNLEDKIERIDHALAVHRPAVVCNLVDHFRGDETAHSLVAAYLELKEVSFTGCDAACMSNCQDRVYTRLALQELGVQVPGFVVLRDASEIPDLSKLVPPLHVSQSYEDTYYSEESEVEGPESVSAKVEELFEDFELPFLVEEQKPGKRLATVVIGREKPEVLPVCEIEDLWTAKPAELTPALLEQAHSSALKAFRCFGCEDLALVEFALSDSGDLHCINVRPVFAPFSENGPFRIGLGSRNQSVFGEIAKMTARAAGITITK